MKPLEVKILKGSEVIDKAAGKYEDWWATSASDVCFIVEHVRGELLRLTLQDDVTHAKVALTHDEVSILKWVLRRYRVQRLGKVEVAKAPR
jgi:hypothetical protein